MFSTSASRATCSVRRLVDTINPPPHLAIKSETSEANFLANLEVNLWRRVFPPTNKAMRGLGMSARRSLQIPAAVSRRFCVTLWGAPRVRIKLSRSFTRSCNGVAIKSRSVVGGPGHIVWTRNVRPPEDRLIDLATGTVRRPAAITISGHGARIPETPSREKWTRVDPNIKFGRRAHLL